MKKTTPLKAGGFAIMQPGTRHFAWTDEETIVQIHSVGQKPGSAGGAGPGYAFLPLIDVGRLL